MQNFVSNSYNENIKDVGSDATKAEEEDSLRLDATTKVRSLKRAMAFILGVNRTSHKIAQEIVLHGIPLRFHFESQEQRDRISSLFPSFWLSEAVSEIANQQSSFQDVFIREGCFSDEDIWDDANPDCEQHIVGDEVFVIQRDFIARKNNAETIALFAPEETDSIYNFLRWLLPPQLLKKNKMLIHSSAKVDSNGDAYLCLGPSGAGKSTIIGMADHQQVLGDDMNIVSEEDGVWFVEAAAVGQAIQNSELLGQRFAIKSVLNLVQSNENSLSEIDPARSALYLIAGVANVFNPGISLETIKGIQNLVLDISTKVNFYNLNFNLDGKVWEYVCRKNQES